MIERPDAGMLMAGPLGTWLAAQQGARDEARAKSRRYTMYGVIGAVVVGLLAMAIFNDAELAFGGAMMAFGAGALFAAAARKKVTDSIKGKINTAIAEALQVTFRHLVSDRRCYDAASAFQLLPSHDDETFEDEWSGEFGGIPFHLHEAKLTEERGSGKNRRTVTVFRGSLMAVEFNRRFHGVTLVERNRARRTWYGAEKETIKLGDAELARANMVDPRFEDVFTVWSNDAVESRYLVHPEYIERLVAVEQAYSGQNIRALFHGGELLIVLETGDLFESGSLDSGDDRNLLERTISQFCSLAELAHKLNERPRAGFGG